MGSVSEGGVADKSSRVWVAVGSREGVAVTVGAELGVRLGSTVSRGAVATVEVAGAHAANKTASKVRRRKKRDFVISLRSVLRL